MADVSGTWSVQERTHSHREYRTYVDRLSRAIAIETAAVLHHLHPTWQMRLVDDSTGEVVHMGIDGKPLPRCSDTTRSPRGLLRCTLPAGHEADPLSLHTINFDEVQP